MNKILLVLILIAPIANGAEHYYKINPEGSNFTYEELATIMRQNFAFFELLSSNTFAPLQETDQDPSFTERTLRFKPDSDFNGGRPNTIMALAARGVMVNIAKTQYLDLEEMRCLLFHEIGHNMGLSHVSIKESIMSVATFRSTNDQCLAWRSDIIKLHQRAPKEGQPNPIGWATVGGDIDAEPTSTLRVRIPALSFGGQQLGLTLKHLYDMNFIVESYYTPTDGVQLVEKAFLTSETDLTVHGVNILGFPWPVPLVFKITPPRNYFVLQPIGN